MIKQSTLPEVFSADEIKGQTVSQTIESNRWFVFPGDFKEENMPKTVAFAFVAQFASPSQVMKFLMGLVGVIRKNSEVCSMFAYSAYDRYGLAADDWRNGLCSVLSSSDLKNLAEHNFTLDEKNIFSNVYGMFNVLYPKESVYDYLQELSGGYIATNMLYDKISQGFEKKFGSAATVFNLPGSMAKDVNLKPVKYLRMDSDLAKNVRFMALPVAYPGAKGLFFNYSTRSGDTENEDKIELAELIRDNLRHKKMSVLKSRFIQTQFGVYIVMNLGVVWLESVHMHYYIMMQIKRNNDEANVADFLSQFVEY
jgi:hypothetical protein